MSEPIAVSNIHKSFASKVLNGVSFAIKKGSIHGLVGENGAGKTTLIRILSGLLEADTGTLELSGINFWPRSRRQALDSGIALVSQELSLIDTLSVADNIVISSLPPGSFKLNRKSTLRRAEALLDQVGLNQINPSDKLSSLALGEKQLVEFAKALAMAKDKQKLLILDEPTSALSATQVDRMHNIISEKAQSGASILYVSHDLEHILKMCDQITVLKDGRVVLSEDNDSLTESKLVSAMSGSTFQQSGERVEKTIGPPILKITSISSDEFPNPISLDLYQGEILGIAGLSGSGRTELLRTIFGLTENRSGQVVLKKEGQDVSIEDASVAVAEGLAMIPEDRSRQGILSRRPLTLNTLISGMAKSHSLFSRLLPKNEQKKTRSLLNKLNVKFEKPSQKIDELSGGNQQKMLVARWLNTDARVWLLDEPTRGVDVGSKVSLHNQLKELAGTGKAMIVASSDLDELMKICDRILVLSKKKFTSMLHPDQWSKRKILDAAFNLLETSEHQSVGTNMTKTD